MKMTAEQSKKAGLKPVGNLPPGIRYVGERFPEKIIPVTISTTAPQKVPSRK